MNEETKNVLKRELEEINGRIVETENAIKISKDIVKDLMDEKKNILVCLGEKSESKKKPKKKAKQKEDVQNG